MRPIAPARATKPRIRPRAFGRAPALQGARFPVPETGVARPFDPSVVPRLAAVAGPTIPVLVTGRHEQPSGLATLLRLLAASIMVPTRRGPPRNDAVPRKLAMLIPLRLPVRQEALVGRGQLPTAAMQDLDVRRANRLLGLLVAVAALLPAPPVLAGVPAAIRGDAPPGPTRTRATFLGPARAEDTEEPVLTTQAVPEPLALPTPAALRVLAPSKVVTPKPLLRPTGIAGVLKGLVRPKPFPVPAGLPTQVDVAVPILATSSAVPPLEEVRLRVANARHPANALPGLVGRMRRMRLARIPVPQDATNVQVVPPA